MTAQSNGLSRAETTLLHRWYVISSDMGVPSGTATSALRFPDWLKNGSQWKEGRTWAEVGGTGWGLAGVCVGPGRQRPWDAAVRPHPRPNLQAV